MLTIGIGTVCAVLGFAAGLLVGRKHPDLASAIAKASEKV